MTATLFSLPRSTIFTTNGVPAVGATVTFYLSGTTTKQTIYSDGALTTALPNPVTANEAGEIPSVYLDPTKTYRVVVKDVDGVTLNDIDPYNTTATAYSFQQLSGATIGSDVTSITTTSYRTGDTKGGAVYVYDAAVNSAFVTAHPGWSVVTANGRGYRISNDQLVNLDMFGAYRDFNFVSWVAYNYQGGSTPYILNTHFHDDFAAMSAAKNWLDFYKLQVGWNAYFKSVPQLHFSRGMHYFSDAIDIVDGMYNLIGAGPYADDNAATTAIYSAPGKCGVIAQSWNTTGVTGTTTNTPKGAGGSLIQDISFFSLGGTLGQEQHGILMKAPIKLIRGGCYDYPGDGVLIAADATHAGNANSWYMEDWAVVRNGRNGITTVGGDSNAGTALHCKANYNAIWGSSENSFLGNTYIQLHTMGNGKPNGSGPFWSRSTLPAGCRRSGLIYRVVPGQETWASTNPPTGTKLRNQGWVFVVDPGYDSNMYPDWVSGIQLRASGACYTSGAANRSCFYNAYMEHDQQLGWHDSPWSMAFMGLQGWTQGAQMTADAGLIRADPGLFSEAVANTVDGIATRVTIAGDMNKGFVLRVTRDKGNAGEVSHGIITDGKDYYWCVNEDTTQKAWHITGEATTLTYGRATSASAKHKLQCNEFFLGQGNAARGMTMAAAAPTTGSHAKGEIVFNDYSSATTPEYWRCTVAGTPGTWVSH